MYYIFAFRSRAESMGLYQRLIAAKLNAKLVSTPRNISIGCGLSVKVATDDFLAAQDNLGACSTSTYLGAYLYNGESIERVV